MTWTRRAVLTTGGAALALPERLAAAPPFATDARLLRRAYEALHPGLYRYNTAAMMAAHFDRLERELAAAPSLAAAYVALARATAAVRCGHSYPNFYNQSDAVVATLFGRRDRLPLLFTWMNRQMIVVRDLSGAGIAPGTEITAIGGVSASAILAALLPLSRADGSNDAKRIRNLDVRGDDRWEAFDLYWPMVFPDLVASGTVALMLHGRDGSAREITVPLMTAAERAARFTAPPATADGALWTLDQLPDGVAWLTMPSWSTYNSKWPWRAWLDARLDEVAVGASRALVVDLRGNEGGEDCGDPIVARLIDRDLATAVVPRLTRYRTVPADLAGALDTWDNSFRDWGAGAVGPDAAGFYRLTKYDDGGSGRSLIRPAAKRFTGRVVVLIDAANSSATFQFAQLVRQNGLATLVGETTGGNRRGINGGAFFFLRLPATGLEVDVPLIATFPPGEPDAGIVPDVTIAPTPLDIATGADPVRTAALAIVRA